MIEYIVSYTGIGLATLMGIMLVFQQSRWGDRLVAEEPVTVHKRYQTLNHNLRLGLGAGTVLMALTGFGAAISHGLGYWNLLIIVHSLGGVLFILVWLPFVVLQAAGVGRGRLFGAFRDAPAHETETRFPRWPTAEYWGMTTFGLLLCITALGMVLMETSQAGQSVLLRTHLIVAWLFLSTSVISAGRVWPIISGRT